MRLAVGRTQDLQGKNVTGLALGQETSDPPHIQDAFLEEIKFQLVSESIFGLGEGILG